MLPRAGLVLVAALIALTALGCGSESGDDAAAGGGGADGDSTEGRPGPAVEVTVTFWPQGKGGPSREATLTCDPAGGTHPDPEAACAALAADAAALEPVPPDSACTMIFGGPEEATVTGVVNGAEVDAELSRSNGCELARWDSLTPLLQIAK
jgi:Subtilisin inhibitor-like